MRLLPEKKAIARFLELDSLFKVGSLEPNSREWRERRELYWQSYAIPGYDNMRPCLSHCEECGTCAYHTLENDEPLFIKNGHTGWGSLEERATQKHFSFCSENCWKKNSEQRDKEWQELINRDFTDFPEDMDLPTFEEFTLWIAHQTIQTKDPDELQSHHPLFIVPEFLAREFRAHLVSKLPQIQLLSRRARISSSGTYTLKPNECVNKTEICKLLDITMRLPLNG